MGRRRSPAPTKTSSRTTRRCQAADSSPTRVTPLSSDCARGNSAVEGKRWGDMKARVLLVVLAAAVLVLLVARLVRPTPQTAPDNPPTNKATESPNPKPSSQANPESTRAITSPQPQSDPPPSAPASLACELPRGSNLQDQLNEQARRRGAADRARPAQFGNGMSAFTLLAGMQYMQSPTQLSSFDSLPPS